MGCWLNLWGARLAVGMLSSYRDACIVFGVTRPGIHARSAINLCSFLHTRGPPVCSILSCVIHSFFSLVFGASTLAAFLPPGSPLAPSGYPPVTPRLPRSLLYSCHFALSSHSVSLSPSVPLSISFALSLSFSFPCFLKETANEQESVLRRSGPHPGPGRSRKKRHRTDPNQPPPGKEKTAVWKKKKRKEERRKDGNSTGQCHNEGTSLCSLTSFFFRSRPVTRSGPVYGQTTPTTI